MLYRISHRTTYSYSEPVSLCHNVTHLTPRPAPRQHCRRSGVVVSPTPAVTSTGVDFFGNPVMLFTVQEPHRQLVVTAEHETDVTPGTPPDPYLSPAWESVRDRLARDRSPSALEACQFAYDSPYIRAGAELAEYAAASFPPGRPLVAAALDLTARIHTDFRYDPSATTVATPLSEVLSRRHGVCQDFAHLEIGCLRSMGLAARYVSGYLRTLPPPGRPRLVGADASHAWASVWCPESGWVDLDPTNNQVPGGQHILLAWGRDYDDVSPVKGVILGGGQHAVSVAVDVVPAEESQ